MYVYVHTCADTSDPPLELEFCAVVSHIVWMLGTELKSTAELSLQPHLFFLKGRSLKDFG